MPEPRSHRPTAAAKTPAEAGAPETPKEPAVQQEADHKARMESARKEREASLPAQEFGAGSGSPVGPLGDDGHVAPAKSLTELVGEDHSASVTVQEDVWEERPVPGSSRTVPHLLFHAGQVVPKSLLQRHDQAAKRKAGEREQKDPADGETKESAGSDEK